MSAPSSGSDSSNIRIGDAERTSALDALGEHLSSGRIDLDEFGTRSAQVTQARTVADLRALFTDLPAPHPTLPGAAPVIRQAAQPIPAAPSAPARQEDSRSPAQRFAGAAVAISGILAVVLFIFVHVPWYIFLLPAVVAILSGAVWGNNNNNR